MNVARLEIKSLGSKLIPLDMDAPGMVDVWTHLDAFLSYEIHNAFFIKATSTKSFIRDQWDGREHLFKKNGTFLTGLLPEVIDTLAQYNIPYETIDHRPTYTSTTPPLEFAPHLDIREYQDDAVNECVSAKRGVIWARPRSGKTVMEVILVQRLNLFPVLSICQSIDVAKQTLRNFQEFLPDADVGIIGDGTCDIKPITIVTIQSLSSAYNIKEKIPKNELERTPSQQQKLDIQKLVEEAKMVWVDECHHAVSSTHKYILQNKIYSAEYILGCSGTPFREDNTNLLLTALIGPIIYEINYSKLIDETFLVRPTIHIVKLPKRPEIVDGSAYSTIYKQAITENEERNGIIARIVMDLVNRKKTCMILVNKVTHGKLLAKMIPSAEFSYSKTKDREQLWIRLRERTLPCLITTLGDEGVDIPSLDATIVAAGGKSAIKVFQRMRCMTPYPGKTHAIVVDFNDPYKYLSSHSKKREKLYKSEPSFVLNYKKVAK